MSNLYQYIDNAYNALVNPADYRTSIRFFNGVQMPPSSYTSIVTNYVVCAMLRYQHEGMSRGVWIATYNSALTIDNIRGLKLTEPSLFDKLFYPSKVYAHNQLTQMIEIHEENMEVLHRLRWTLHG